MKSIYTFLVLALLLVLSACSHSKKHDDQKHDKHSKNEKHSTKHDHLGCGENEVVDGECVIAEEGQQNVDLFTNLSSIDVKTEEVSYMENVNGYLARPSKEGVYPAVVMIHEWWGLNDNVRDMARLLANEGYVVLAADIYEGEVAETSDQAKVLAGAARKNTEKSVANMKNAVEYLQTLEDVDPERVGSMGWCFGGQQSLNLALNSDDLGATVIYYGNLIDDKEQLQSINWPVLGIFGAEDTGIPVDSVRAFEASLNELNIKNEIHVYDDVGHAFANPSGSRYAPEETLDAWNKTVEFLRENL
jgi:carboxymethylenebutenolidase